MTKSSDFLPNGFNLDSAGYLTMFNTSPPTSLIMLVNFMTVPGVDYRQTMVQLDKAKDTIDLLAAKCAVGGLVQQSKLLPDSFAIGLGGLQEATWSIMPPAAKAWAVDGIYVEAGYHVSSVKSDRSVVSLVCDAMMLYDVQVAISGSVEPIDHPPLPVGRRFAGGFSQAMGDLYRSKIGVWSRELLDHRTMILIICRAMIMGRDPVTEYHRFLAAGGTYFLQYPELCP